MEPNSPTFQQISELFQLSTPHGSTEIEESELSGDNADESSILGRQALTDGNVELALRHFKRAAAQRGTLEAEDGLNIAATYAYRDDIPLAYRQYKLVLQSEAESAEALVGLSELYKRQGRHRDAVAQLELAIKNEPNNAFHAFKLSETLLGIKERTSALHAIKRAILINPSEALYFFWMGDILLQLDRFEEALESFRAAVELSPGDDYYLIRSSIAFWHLGKRQEAIKAIRLACELAPEKDSYHGLLEALLEEDGQIAEADLESDRADKMDSYDQEMVRRWLAEMNVEVSA